MLAHLFGGQDLPADRLGHHSRRSVHRLPVQVAVALGDLAGVDADAYLDGVLGIGCVVLVQRALDGGGGTDRCHGGREGDEEAVAQGLAHPATELPDLVVHDSGLQPQNVVGVSVTARPPQRGRADDISHHDGELLGRAATSRQRLPPSSLAAQHLISCSAPHLPRPRVRAAGRAATLRLTSTACVRQHEEADRDQVMRMDQIRRSVSGSGPSKYLSMTCLKTA